jgi:hypothetical protein
MRFRKRTRFKPVWRSSLGLPQAGKSAIANPVYSPFAIRYSSFERCHTLTLAKKMYFQNKPI